MMRGGPLPPAEELVKYPNEARELILRLAEQMIHRHAVELDELAFRRERLKSLDARHAALRRQIARGQAFGFGICVFSLATGLAIALGAQGWSGHLAGGFVSVFGLSGLAYVFIRGRHPQKPRRPRPSEPRAAPPRPQSN